jgi:hypothetical protein
MTHPSARPKLHRLTRLPIAVLAGVLADLYSPIPGMIIAAVFFDGGVHSNFPMLWIITSYVANFLLAVAAVYALWAAIVRREEFIDAGKNFEQ